jgi:threonine dehydratase
MTTEALRLIRAVAHPTPVEPLGLEHAAQILVKREDLGPTGTFKWRGALTACDAYRAAGVTELVTASTGNHGAAVAWAAARLGLTAHVVVPREAAASKCDIVAAHGARLHRVGDDLDDSGAFAVELANERGIPFFEDGASVAQLDGTATVGVEMADLPPVDAVFIPVACGALAAGVGAGLQHVSPRPWMVGVQSIHFSRLTARFHRRPYASTGQPTFADGLADDRLIEPALSACIKHLDDMITVDEDQLREAVRALWEVADIRAEGAGAAALAGLLNYNRRAFRGSVALILSGGNLDASAAEELLGTDQTLSPT